MSLPLILEPEALLSATEQHSNLLIVDLCSPNSYEAGHVPNAVYVHPSELMLGQPPAPGKLPPKERLDALFSHLGLTPDTHVVVYDDEGGGWAGRMIWTLDVIGHKHYSYLNGGIHAWRAAGLQLSIDSPETQSKDISVTIGSTPMVTKEELLQRLDGNTLVWDARSAAEHSGERVVSARGGHIPGAINCDWTWLMDRERELRIRTDAKDYLASLGIDGSKPIVTHCQSHHRSGFTYLVGKSLGFNIQAYPGSWSEWGNDPNTPIEQ